MTLYLVLLLSTVLPRQDVDGIVEVVLDEFATHRVVAIGENHGHREFHEMIVALLEHPESVDIIDDIVVEWGNSLYQEVVDRYVGGESVPWDSVTMVWRNTVVSPNTVWDSPVYERFFRQIRRINEALRPDQRYRVLLADSPVDWGQVANRDQLRPYFDRAQSMADVIRRESLLAGRRSLFLAGGLHVSLLPRVRINPIGVPVSEITPVGWLELWHPGVTYVIQSMGRASELGLHGLRSDGPGPVLTVAAAPPMRGIAANRSTTLKNRDGSTSDVYGNAMLADIVDAVIMWGDSQLTFEEPLPSTYQIDWYWDELNRRSLMLRNEPMDPSLRH